MRVSILLRIIADDGAAGAAEEVAAFEKPVVFRSLYGDVPLASPRLHRCPCQGTGGAATVSPLRDLIPGQIAPERLYLEARWASLVPYAATAGLLADVLPIASGANRTTVREHALRVAERAEAELGKSGPVSSRVAPPNGPRCRSRKGASWPPSMAATSATGTTGRATSS